MGRSKALFRDERGVTLIELLALISVMVAVFATISWLAGSSYEVYSEVNDSALAEKQAVSVLRQIEEDLRDATSVVLRTDGGVELELQDGRKVSYRNNNGSIVYRSSQLASDITLTESGAVQVREDRDVERGYGVDVRIFAAQDRTRAIAERSTTVTLYDWGK